MFSRFVLGWKAKNKEKYPIINTYFGAFVLNEFDGRNARSPLIGMHDGGFKGKDHFFLLIGQKRVKVFDEIQADAFTWKRG